MGVVQTQGLHVLGNNVLVFSPRASVGGDSSGNKEHLAGHDVLTCTYVGSAKRTKKQDGVAYGGNRPFGRQSGKLYKQRLMGSTLPNSIQAMW